jgi:hypothetical protein
MGPGSGAGFDEAIGTLLDEVGSSKNVCIQKLDIFKHGFAGGRC